MGKGAGHITNTLRALRFHQGEMTQQERTDRIGVTRQTVHALVGNTYSPAQEVAFLNTWVFNIPLEEVFQYGEEYVGRENARSYSSIPYGSYGRCT